MKASIVIPSRGGAQRLPILLSALAAQTYPDWEAIVVIDGDIDNSEAVVAQYAHLPIRSIVFPENRGRVAALNAGFAAATGDVLIRADDDFEPYPWHVAAHLDVHRGEPVGAIGLPQNIAPNNAYMRAYGAYADERGRRDAYALDERERWKMWGGNVSCTRETYERVGGYSSQYQGYGWEDVDFGYRVHKLGIPIVLVHQAEVRHHMASVTTAVRVGRAYASGTARFTFDRLHGQGISGMTTPPRDGIWHRLVAALAAIKQRRIQLSIARSIDLVLPLLPTPLGRKLVALCVEAAAWAGYQSISSEKQPLN